MTRPRGSIVSTDVTRYYHCITKCVRQAFLLQEGKVDRKQWLINRLKEVAEVYAVSVSNFAILDNHFHLLLRLDVEVAQAWSDKEVVLKWAKLHPPRKNRKPIPLSDQWLAEQLADKQHIDKLRKRLCNLGWFMKEVKEPLARLCNQEDKRTGTFFEGRFKSIAILDAASLLATSIYIDLNPFAAALVPTPESSTHTSLFERLEHVKSIGRAADLAVAKRNTSEAISRSFGLEDDLWLIPLEDRRNYGGAREGLIESLPLGSYLLILDEMARKPREGKAFLSSEVRGIFDRLNCDAQFWIEQRARIYGTKLVGCFFASSRVKLRAVAQQLGLHHCWNLSEKVSASSV